MITTNIGVTDELTNGAVGMVTNVVIEQTTGKISVILVAFDSEYVGQEARYTSVDKSINQNTVPIHQTWATFPVDKKASFQATRIQFPLKLVWAFTIHKCQGLTLSEIVIDMAHAKGKFKPGEAYVAFSRVKTLEKLHNQLHTKLNPCIRTCRKRDEKAQEYMLPQMPSNLFHDIPGGVKILHLNIGNLKRKIEDIKDDDILKNSDIISFNETHLVHSDTLTTDMMGISTDVLIVCCDHNNRGGGVALIANKKLSPKQIRINTILEIVAVKISEPIQMIVVSVYRPPSRPIDVFMNHMLEIIAQFQHVPTCIVGDFNEDVSITSNTCCCGMFRIQVFKQMVSKLTHDSVTIIDHVYVSQTVNTMQTDVTGLLLQ